MASRSHAIRVQWQKQGCYPYTATVMASQSAAQADGLFLSGPGAKLFDWLSSEFKGKPAEASLETTIAEPQNQH